jgi:phage tail-like protein
MGDALPGLYREDDLVQRLMAALDEVLAPVFVSLDDFGAYLDPALAPEDFLEWLGGWVGVLLDETWTIERRRAFVAMAAELYRQRGTAAGMAEHVRIFTSGDVDIEESGGSAWSPTTGAGMPGTSDLSLVVRVRVPKPASVDAVRLDALVAAAKPAHVLHRVEVVASKGA